MLFKNTIIKIKKSFGRYISIFVIVMIGVGFFAGIQASSPDMIALSDDYYKNHNLMDFKIVSSMGLTNDDADKISELKNVDSVIPSYSLDVISKGKTIRLHAIEDSVNTVELIEGRMPDNHSECIADSKNYKIGDIVTVTSGADDKLNNLEFTVVGTVKSVLYLSEDYGNTTIGDGKLSSFIFIDKDNFNMDAYTEIYIKASGIKNIVSYSKQYDAVVSELNNELIDIKASREDARYQEIYNKAYEEINENQIKLDDEKSDGAKKLADAKTELDNNAQKLKDAKETIASNEADLQQNIEEQSAKFEAAESEITEGYKNINSALTSYGITTDELDTKISELKSAIESMNSQLSQLPASSTEYSELNNTVLEYTKSYQGLLTLKDSIDKLSESKNELENGINTFNTEIEKAEDELEKGKDELAENEKKLNNGYNEYYENLNTFNTETSDAQIKIDDASKSLEDIEKPEWYIFDRDAAIGYDELKSGINVVASVAAVFPFFFILIVVLMTSNSTTRMIAEERGELGTLASLGFKNSSIIMSYIFYVLSASVLGVITGFFIGCGFIPPLIYSMFRFILPPLTVHYDIITFSIILSVTILLMTFVTVVSCKKELRNEPAALMRPLPPKKGHTILFEKIGFIWKHLSFTWKVTLRNMIRYKKRALMTIVGVAGCTSLLLAGFGLRDSMDGVAEKQYGEIFKYDDMAILKDGVQSSQGELSELLSEQQINNSLLIKQTSLKCSFNDDSIDSYLIVPENTSDFCNYFNLKDKLSGDTLLLDTSGVIITQKLSEFYKAGKGDSITVKDAENNEFTLTVSGIAENYTANYIYMESDMFIKIFGGVPLYNTLVFNYGSDEKALAEKLIDTGFILNVVSTGDVLQKALDTNESLNSIIILIVVVASLLAFIVLYNLTSINISERKREIATLKVLGFTDGETNGYIYREAIILTFISIAVGLVAGIFLHRFVVDSVEGFGTLFFKNIKWLSFIMAGALTLIFSLIMQLITFFKLRTIDMIDSMKSVE